ncbi:AraC family transcriptional regulator [Sphingobacterium faecium]|uniref:AraC family transcriptional regulator n=1 Tax=Sphingobacterium faecium TaxID=34087 RepID=UPI002468D78A|nr:helix-turn-helix domain-containing protein [Sphingobacterium faecium]MDH5825867.1 helix-turn-helix domain-containing protein [Sphingobacterium faecium]
MVIKTGNINTLTLGHLDPDHNGIIVYNLQKDGFGCLQELHLPNRRTFYTVIYLTSGVININMDKYACRLESMQVISFSPSTVLRVLDENEKKEGWVLLFEACLFTQQHDDGHPHFAFLREQKMQAQALVPEERQVWNVILETMQREYRYRHPDAKNILRSYLTIILETLDRNVCPEMVSLPKDEKEEKVISFERLLEERYANQRFPSFYADQLFISANYLNRLCRERRGISAGQMIRDRVLVEAERLLIHTYKQIAEISFELGFENVSYFITFFKKKYGHTPEEFRKMQ